MLLLFEKEKEKGKESYDLPRGAAALGDFDASRRRFFLFSFFLDFVLDSSSSSSSSSAAPLRARGARQAPLLRLQGPPFEGGPVREARRDPQGGAGGALVLSPLVVLLRR